VARDLRPIFPEETRLIEVLLDRRPGDLARSSIWACGGNNIIIDGETTRLSKRELLSLDPASIRRRLLESYPEQCSGELTESIATFVKLNEARFRELSDRACEIVSEVRSLYPSHYPVVSFSGGKDSTVVSDVARRGHANQSILHVFGDTTLEMPSTYEYISRFNASNRVVPFLKRRSRHDFRDLCERIGPPSRVMRWCCTVFKTGPIGQLFDNISGSSQILTYYGVRWSESSKRSSYELVSESPKLARQTVVSPIIGWNDSDVWLYILSRGLDFNDAYRYGFTRVGCWCCPSNSLWSFFLMRVYHPELADPWRDFLIDFATKAGKPDPIEYVDSGNWKARQGGHGVSGAKRVVISSRMCGDDRYAKTYTLSRPIDSSLYEYFKPFGKLSSNATTALLGEVTVTDRVTGKPVMMLQGILGQNRLRVKVFDDAPNFTLLMQRVDCQVRKYQSCILCGGCPSVCPQGAVLDTSGSYRIDEERCVGCLQCVNHFDTGCLVSKVLRTKKES
jgi:phosphoadenosine phosphosulfate reductase